MTLPNLPPNKFTSVLCSVHYVNNGDGTYTVDSSAVNVSSVVDDGAGYTRVNLTQPIPRSVFAPALQTWGILGPAAKAAAAAASEYLGPWCPQCYSLAVDDADNVIAFALSVDVTDVYASALDVSAR